MGGRQELAAELVGRAHVHQVALADGGDHLVAERAERGVLLLGLVGRLGPLGDLGDQVTRVEFPLLAAAVEQLDIGMPVEPEVPVRVRGEPVVVPAVENHQVVVGDAARRQQFLEAVPVNEVAAHRVLEILLPVDLYRVGDVALVVSGGVLVHLDKHHPRITEMGLHPVGVHQDIGAGHAGTSLSCSGCPVSWVDGQNRRIITYISQPRHRPKAALRKAAASASAAATMPSTVTPVAYPITPITLMTRPTHWENRGGASSSSSAGGPSRGRTSQRKMSP